MRTYSRDPNKSDALNRGDGWKIVNILIRVMVYNKGDAWKFSSLPVLISNRQNGKLTKKDKSKHNPVLNSAF